MIRIGLRSGGLVTIDDKNVDVSKVTLDDIAYGIGEMQRFTCQMNRLYSVAEHSIILSELIPPTEYDRKIAALWHDAAECLGISDVHHELKPPALKKVEGRISAALAAKFKLPDFQDKDLDTQLGAYEAGTITPFKDHFLTDIKLPARFRFWSKSEAASMWKTTYQLYLNSRTYLATPLPTAALKPGVPFFPPNVPNVEPAAVIARLKLDGAVEAKGGQYVVG